MAPPINENAPAGKNHANRLFFAAVPAIIAHDFEEMVSIPIERLLDQPPDALARRRCDEAASIMTTAAMSAVEKGGFGE
jgi:hypothetical protein